MMMRPLIMIAALAVAQAQPSLDTLLDRMHAYLLEYEPRISELIADETLTQSARENDVFGDVGQNRRLLQSEIAFMRLPGDGPWLGYRNVLKVNGGSVRSSEARLQRLLAPGRSEEEQARQIAEESARHNLGPVRTTNVPTLPLELLHPRNRERFVFTLLGRARVIGRQVVRIGFQETKFPTLISDSERGGDLLSRGDVWIEEATGRVFQAEVRTNDPRLLEKKVVEIENVITVTFDEHKALGMLVPSRVRETFPHHGRVGRGDAHYSNFRKFSTSARIIPQI
jgi:hypothetical protein